MSAFDSCRVLSFDCYGTLIDWETGITAHLRQWADRVGAEVDDDQLLALFASIEHEVQGEHSPALLYPDVLAETLGRIGERTGVTVTDGDAQDFGRSVGQWPAFTDAAAALSRLSPRFQLVIVSNVDRASFAASNERLGVEFDRIITAEDVGSYKPRPAHFEALLGVISELGAEAAEHVHVAQSLFHDHEPARRHGIESVWIDRRHGQPGSRATPEADVAVAPTLRFPSLAAFADRALGHDR